MSQGSVAGSRADSPELAALYRCYAEHVPPGGLGASGPAADQAALWEAVVAARALAARRVPGAPAIEVRGGERSGPVVEIVTDELPDLVESVLVGVGRAGGRVRGVIHPVVRVRRALSGELIEVLVCPDAPPAPHPDGTAGGGAGAATDRMADSSAQRGADANEGPYKAPSERSTKAPHTGPDAGATAPAAARPLREVWMHLELDPFPLDELDDLAAELRRVLRDLRELVEDRDRMVATAHRVAAELAARARRPYDKQDLPQHPDNELDTEVTDAARLLRWLAAGRFTFLGYRRYQVTADGRLRAELASGLGVLRRDSLATRPFVAASHAERPLVLTRSSTPSRVIRPVYPYHLGVAILDQDGEVVGEHRFLGLLTLAALQANVLDIPAIERRVRAAIHRAGYPLESHAAQRMLEVLADYPRAELFWASEESLRDTATGLLSLTQPRRLRLFLHREPYRRFFSCLVYLPRDRYSTKARLALQQLLMRELDGWRIDHTARVGESNLALVHFVVQTDPDTPEPDRDRLQSQLAAAILTWDDWLLDLVGSADPELAEYLAGIPEGYKDDVDPVQALGDLRRVRDLGAQPELSVELGADPGELRLRLFLSGEGITLSSVLPVLQSLGVEVVDERPYRINRPDGTRCWIYQFGLRVDAQTWVTIAGGRWSEARRELCAAFLAAWRGDAEVDRFNTLVLRLGLRWREAALLRCYASYLRQLGSPFDARYQADTLLAHPDVTRALVRLFHARFDTARSGAGRADGQPAALERSRSLIDRVIGLDADRILRGFLSAILATLRTNYFRARPYLSMKFDPHAIPEMPAPRPRFEIFVHSPTVEGVHLRFGPVARGGLRWSDRPSDFRTEILGLAKAQAVKNAVIVPVGAKGGFVIKATQPGPDQVTAGYRTFVSGLLDLTDNLVDGVMVPPEGVARHDGDDSYLVVAADKGTATFSDIANSLAVERGFWLGDAFASGGSVGYDHKAMGITAKGAWESVKRHFRELGVDTQSQEFSVVGIGDMSGDVFGNGMLLSEHIKLVAAFDHRHIFIDPDPDPARCYAERRRLFELPRSSWEDYDRSLISEGGGVWSRTTKAISVSAPMRAALGLEETDRALSPPELIRAILLAPVDLLWNGGVGTYVKASSEANSEVGDKANDPVRVNGEQLRVKVVGEGGNLGLTQRGRIEFARAGGKVNTDALDNSAGVDCSDHEVNIKIPLGRLVAAGELTEHDRRELLAEMTDEVGQLVLDDNRSQNTMLGVARSHAAAMCSVHARLVADLESRAGLDRELEVLPTPAGFAALERAGRGLTSPELAILLAHVKLDLKAAILASDLPDAAVFGERLAEYFPTPLRERYPRAIAEHPLRREILTTLLVNEMVDGAGTTFAFRLSEEMAVEPADALRAYATTTRVFRLPELWADIERCDISGELDTGLADELVLESRRLTDRAVRWFLTNRPQPLAIGAEISRFASTVAAMGDRVPGILSGREAEVLTARVDDLVKRGVPTELAERTAGLLSTYPLLDIIEITELAEREHSGEDAERDPVEVAELYYAMSEHLGIDLALTSVSNLERGNRWHALARLALRDDLYGSLRAITLDALRGTAPGSSASDKIAEWERTNASRLSRARAALQAVGQSGELDLATLSVISRQLRGLAR